MCERQRSALNGYAAFGRERFQLIVRREGLPCLSLSRVWNDRPPKRTSVRVSMMNAERVSRHASVHTHRAHRTAFERVMIESESARYCGGAGGCVSAGMPRGGLFAATRSSDRLVRSVAIAWSVLAGFNCSRASESYT